MQSMIRRASQLGRLVRAGMVTVVVLEMSAFAAVQSLNQGTQNPGVEDAEIHILPIRENVYMLVGAGGNVTLQIGDDGVLVVDTQFPGSSGKILEAIRRVSDKPIRYIINTHIHADHTGGNESIAQAGAGRGGVTDFLGDGARVIAHENVYHRMSGLIGEEAPRLVAAWPTTTFIDEEMDFFFNGEAIQVFHQPAGHTDGDSIVFFRRSDVVSTGDIFVTTSYPVIDVQRGGHINGIIDGLNHILALTVPEEKQEGGTMVIPGHGRLCDEADVFEYRNMVTIIRDRIRDMIQKGMTLEQVKAARPTVDYDVLYGTDTGSWTTEMFVEAVYQNLSSRP